MSAEIKILPHRLHDYQDAKINREIEPQRRIDEIKENFRWLEGNGMTKEIDDLIFDWYFEARK